MTADQNNSSVSLATSGFNADDYSDVSGMKFRDAMDEIASIASILDSKGCELEDMVAYHKRSIALINFCKEKLKNAKLEIENVSASEVNTTKKKKNKAKNEAI